MNWTVTARTTAVAGIMLLAGCATQTQFGESVRHMTQQQIYNPDAAYNPDPAPPIGAEVDRLNKVLESHRNSVSDPAEASRAPVIDIRGQGQ